MSPEVLPDGSPSLGGTTAGFSAKVPKVLPRISHGSPKCGGGDGDDDDGGHIFCSRLLEDLFQYRACTTTKAPQLLDYYL